MIQRRTLTRLAPALAVLFVLGCSIDDVTQPETLAWQGTLHPIGAESQLGGSVAALGQYRTTDAGITLRNATPGEAYAWSIAAGSCADTETVEPVAGVFPVLLEPDETGEVETQLAFAGVLDRDTDYVGIVRDAEDEVPLACADLEFTSNPAGR